MVETRRDLTSPSLPFLTTMIEQPLQDPLLGDDLFAGVARSPAISLFPFPTPLPPFPCLADEMEEQAKAMEFELLSEQQQNLPASTAATAAVKIIPQQVPALRVRTFDVVQQRAMVPVAVQSNGGGGTTNNNNRPPLPTALLQQQHYVHQQQQQQRVAAMHSKSSQQQQQQYQQQHLPAAAAAAALSPLASSAAAAMQQRSAPLAAALHNADCVRAQMKSPWPGAWTGCLSGPWCTREKTHGGACNSRATIPGLSAYLPEELAAVGLPAVIELTAPLPPAAAAAALAGATAAAKAAMVSGGAILSAATSSHIDLKRKAHSDFPVTSSDGEDSLTASDNNSNNGDDEDVQQQQQQQQQKQRQQQQASRRRRKAAPSKRKKAAYAATAATAAAVHDVDGLDASGTDNEAASEELKSSMTGEAKLRTVEPTPPRKRNKTAASNKKARKGARPSSYVDSLLLSKGAAAAAGVLMSDAPVTSAAAAAAAAAGVGSFGGVAEKVAPRPNGGRRAPQQWISGETVDPRSGKKVKEVPSATFCTQCSATSTPVWRAGPFGHKTLCNACGVRWMKVAPRARK